MGVQGYLSLYTILLGWQAYDAIWNILCQTGLVALPFAFIAVKSFMEPLMSMGAKDAGVIASRRFVIHIMSALFVLLFAAIPMVKLQPNVLHFKPHCEHSNKVATPGNTGTTYDKSFTIPTDAKVPMIWYIVMAVSNGITDEAEDAISCPAVNLRGLQEQINIATIKSVPLKNEIHEFYRQCYMPAYNHYVQQGQAGVNQLALNRALGKYGRDDISWVGSETFLYTPGYYDSFYAKNPIKGFPYTNSSINNQLNAQTEKPKWAAPSCKSWWDEPETGLKHRIYSQFSYSLNDYIEAYKEFYHEDLSEIRSELVKLVLYKSTDGGYVNPGYYTEQDNQSGIDNYFAKWFSKYQIDSTALHEYPKVQIIKNALPIVQAILLAAFCMILAIAIPISSYSIRFLISASVFMFGVIFCSYLWHWVSWFDQVLMQALYPAKPYHVSVLSTKDSLLVSLADNVSSPEKNLLNMTISAFYLVLPLIFISVIGWTGIAVGGVFSFAAISGVAGRGAGMPSMNMPSVSLGGLGSGSGIGGGGSAGVSSGVGSSLPPMIE